MQLSNLPKLSQKSKKRVGRGHGSGRGGHTSTRGSKGQKSRGSVGLFFEGTKVKKSLLKRLPLFRGKGKLKSLKPPALVVNLKYLNVFKAQDEVSLTSLMAKGILPKGLPKGTRAKILGEGEIGIPLLISLPISKKAKEKIEKAGGRIIEAGSQPKKAETKKEEKRDTSKKEEGGRKQIKKSVSVKKSKLPEAVSD